MRPSRAMITGEVSWAYIALCFAWAGAGGWPLEPTWLYYALLKAGHQVVWPLVMSIPALLLTVTSMREWCAHGVTARRVGGWGLVALDQSAKMRARLCLLMVLSWAYMLYMLPAVSEGMNVLEAIAAGGCGITWWFYKENRRVRREIRQQTFVGVAAS